MCETNLYYCVYCNHGNIIMLMWHVFDKILQIYEYPGIHKMYCLHECTWIAYTQRRRTNDAKHNTGNR